MSTSAIPQLALGDFEHELQSTRRLLERVPDAHWDWKPHAKSATLGALASHVASIIGLQNVVLRADDMDLLDRRSAPPAPATNRAELLALFDRTVESVRASLATITDDATWHRMWTFRRGEHVVFAMPKVAAFRTFGLSHLIHHRGQLSVYLRLLDVPIPGMYGPSADEP